MKHTVFTRFIAADGSKITGINAAVNQKNAVLIRGLKQKKLCSPFLARGDFHARLRFARCTIVEEKWGTTRSLNINHPDNDCPCAKDIGTQTYTYAAGPRL